MDDSILFPKSRAILISLPREGSEPCNSGPKHGCSSQVTVLGKWEIQVYLTTFHKSYLRKTGNLNSPKGQEIKTKTSNWSDSACHPSPQMQSVKGKHVWPGFLVSRIPIASAMQCGNTSHRGRTHLPGHMTCCMGGRHWVRGKEGRGSILAPNQVSKGLGVSAFGESNVCLA